MNRQVFNQKWDYLNIGYEIWGGDDFIEEIEGYGQDTIYTLAPYHLGFVDCNMWVELTPAGENLLASRRTDEVFLRQMLKFQIPSPYHKPTTKAAHFCIKPFLEMLRLVRTMGSLKFDELQIFGMQLTDWHDFNKVVRKIEHFRVAKAENKGNYKKFKTEYLHKELRKIFNDRIRRGETKTRESNDTSLANFLTTQSSNMRYYADACFRYLRATGLVSVSYIGKSLSIVPERIEDVDYILKTVSRDPVNFVKEADYVEYLGKADTPKLLTDDRKRLTERIRQEFHQATALVDKTEQLKDRLAELIDARKTETINAQIANIKNYKEFDDIQQTFAQIENNTLFDAPLMMEWNTWRAMTMLDGGDIRANLNFDDYGRPLSTAAGNMADIVCDYGDYMVCVEVTLASGQRQYNTESEPVARHLGKLKASSGKPCYCLFVAPTINAACISHFYTLHHVNIEMYGGKATIIPMPLNVFQKMLEDSYKANYTPNPSHVRRFFEFSKTIAETASSELDWYNQITDKALHWLG